MHSYISWVYLNINDDEFNPSKQKINLSDNISRNAVIQFEEKFPDLFSVLFNKNESEPNLLELKIPFSSYLGTNSRSEEEMLLRAFFDDNSSKQWKSEKFKPFYLSRDTLDMEVYKLFCLIIKNVNEWEDDFGYLSLGFDSLRGYVACDGDAKWEAECFINYDGIHWSK